MEWHTVPELLSQVQRPKCRLVVPGRDQPKESDEMEPGVDRVQLDHSVGHRYTQVETTNCLQDMEIHHHGVPATGESLEQLVESVDAILIVMIDEEAIGCPYRQCVYLRIV